MLVPGPPEPAASAPKGGTCHAIHIEVSVHTDALTSTDRPAQPGHSRGHTLHPKGIGVRLLAMQEGAGLFWVGDVPVVQQLRHHGCHTGQARQLSGRNVSLHTPALGLQSHG